MKIFGLYVHSWFSWCVTNSFARRNVDACYVFILGRGFRVPADFDIGDKYILRFEPSEIQLLNSKDKSEAEFIINKLLGSIVIDELLIPHIGYKPFHDLCSSTRIKSVSFYQESIQLPKTLLAEREARLLIKQEKNVNSLYTSYNTTINQKITKNYYAISDEVMPLHMNINVVGDIKKQIQDLLPISSANNVDFALIAGKSTNKPSGVKLFSNILDIICFFYPGAKIVLKASPSSSQLVCAWMQNKSAECKRIEYNSGDVSIENSIVSGIFSCLITEMFTLSNLAMLYSSKTSIISLEKTIVKDFPSLKDCLTERNEHKCHESLAHSCLSLSEYIKMKS